MANYEIRNKKLYNSDNGKVVLVQIGNSFFALKIDREITDISEIDPILNNNDCYLMTKGD